ncbi:type IV pilin [Methanohalophilus profundi]|uniref:type IV pilin n=1 Tax=Methanohalophilus profundi TaxID=2138083 RepID=UPI00101BF600|nr:type IV pilin [Methanohalophilus profundi]
MKDEKAISPVVGIMLMIAITIVLGVTLIFFATAFEMQEPAPFVAHSSGELVRDVDGGDDQKVYLYHEGGDCINLSDIEIVVDATEVCGERVKLVNLPAEHVPYVGVALSSENIEGNEDIFDKSSDGIAGAIKEIEFSTGELLMFRINSGENACPLKKGDQITVKIIHTPTNTVIIEETLTAS